MGSPPVDSPGMEGRSTGPEAPRGVPEPAGVVSGVVLYLRDPVVLILLLAGTFDGLSGNPIHSILLFATAFALGWDRARRRGEPPASATVVPERAPSRLLVAMALIVSVAYAVTVGGFGRYSWPTTISVLALGAFALVVAWRGRRHPEREPASLDPLGAVAWASAFVALALWELANLLLQPNLTTDSYAHPTLSVLTDPILASHIGRSIILSLWLAFGWFLLER
jgi:hypothetical protein